MNRDLELDITRRCIDLVQRDTTCYADSMYESPIEVYTSPEQLTRERRKLFAELPILAALSCELAEPGDWKALDVDETPVLLVRDRDGSVNAFLNVCRHRGTKLKEDRGSGAKVLTCRYHAWSYNTAGELVHVPGAEGFDGLCREKRGLVPLPVAERHGAIWVQADQAATIDIDDYLGTIGPELATWEMAGWTFIEAREHRIRANWKTALETFGESYHLEYLHPDTVGLFMKSNKLLFDDHGRHSRIVYMGAHTDVYADMPESEWTLFETWGLAILYLLFPNTIITNFGDHIEMFQIFPGETPDSARIVQTLLGSPKNMAESGFEVMAEKFDMIYDVVAAEDFVMSRYVTENFKTGVNDTLLFGRNELPIHHMHHNILRALSDT